MGGASSKSKTDIFNRTVVNALSSSIMNCTDNKLVSQRFEIYGSYNVVKNFRQVQSLKVSSECFNNQSSIMDLRQKVENAIKQEAEAKNVALLGIGTSSKSETFSKIRN